MFEDLEKFITTRGMTITEGNIGGVQKKIELLRSLSKNAQKILEIGFNAGHSSCLFLNENDNCKVTSIDLNMHDYTLVGKQFIDLKFPDRHTLLVGDSRVVLKQLISSQETFDLIFVDGGHDYEIAKSDLHDCLKLCNKNTYIVLDDTITENKSWHLHFTIGPTQAWNDLIESKDVVSLGFYDISPGLGITWGRRNNTHLP